MTFDPLLAFDNKGGYPFNFKPLEINENSCFDLFWFEMAKFVNFLKAILQDVMGEEKFYFSLF